MEALAKYVHVSLHFLNRTITCGLSPCRKHVHGGLLWRLCVHPSVQTVLRVDGRIQVPLVPQRLLPMHRTWMRGLWQQGSEVHELSLLKCGHVLVPNVWTITEGRGNYDCYASAFLSYLVKYPPHRSAYPCKLFLFCCYISLYIFRNVFNSVFFFFFLLEVYMNNVFLQLWYAKSHICAK